MAEVNTRQHVLTFEKGLTNSPSDLMCPDDTLKLCDGAVLEDGEWRAIQKLIKTAYANDLAGELMYVHRGDNYHHYIYKKDTNVVYQNEIGGESNNIELEDTWVSIIKVIAVGNTLVVNTDKGMMYCLWTGSTYKYLGLGLPEINIDFSLVDDGYVSSSFSTEGCIEQNSSGEVSIKYDDGGVKHYTYNNSIIGAYSEAKNSASKSNKFHSPFFVRAAIELIDGDYTMATSPILVCPCIRRNNHLEVSFNGGATDHGGANLKLHVGELKFKLNTDYSSWSDIVRGVTLFVTRQTDINDTNSECFLRKVPSSPVPYGETSSLYDDYPPGKYVKYDGIYSNGTCHRFLTEEWDGDDEQQNDDCFLCLPLRKKTDIDNDIENSSIFYKICEIGISKNDSYETTKNKIKTGVLENILTQQILSDGFFDHTTLVGGNIESYNRRLNVFGPTRSMFGGFDNFILYNEVNGPNGSPSASADFYVEISTPSGNRTVKSTSKNIQMVGNWFFYPDTRAKKVTVFIGPSKVYESDLKFHSGLNGVYAFKMPNYNDAITTESGTAPAINNSPESLSSTIVQSDANNPFTFKASGYVRIGQGKIIGMAGLTTALSQDAYKMATTIVFTEQGIWALQTDDTGQYKQVVPPFSREVCTNANSITMVDNAVFFASKKGLMCITDTSESGVVCVSEKLKGKGFSDFYDCIDSCKIAYDYKAGLLYVIDDVIVEGATKNKVFIYSIKSGTWSRGDDMFVTENGHTVGAVVSDYPDTLVQVDRFVFSAINTPVRDADTNTYSFTMESRPLKLEGSLFEKSLRDVKVLKNVTTEGATVTATIYGCNDVNGTWMEIESRRGKSWKFFKIKIEASGMSAMDAVSGVILETQKRFTNRMR